MSGPGEVPGPIPPKQDPREFVLRGKPRPVVRFRRGLIVGITGAVAATLVTLSWLALEPPSLRKAASSAVGDRPASSGRADALANAPTTYGDVPRLGAPLPGDLGRPILDHQRSVGAAPPEVALDSEAARAADEQRRRIASAKQAARISPLIVELAGGRDEAAASSAALPAEAPAEEVPSAQIAVAAGDQHKTASTRSSGSSDLNPHALVAPASPWTLTAGTVIPASLITGLDSDLPGIVLAQVTENVRDSATGRTVLIPQGARLIGHYDSRVAYGQRRALLVWTRIVLPDGSSIRLDNMPATDRSGFAGLEDEVDSHSWSLLKGVALSTLLGVGTQLSIAGSESDLVRALRESAQQSAANAGDRITVRNLDVRPTIRVRPGWPVRAIVATDLVLQPWRG